MTEPLTLGNKLGAISRKIFAARSAIEFTHLMEEFRVEHRDQVLHEAAELLLTDADLRTAEGEITTPREWRDAAQFLLAARSAQTPQET